MFQFKEGDLAHLSATELATYREEIEAAFRTAKEAGTADLDFLTKVRSELQGIRTQLATKAVESELAADVAEADEDEAPAEVIEEAVEEATEADAEVSESAELAVEVPVAEDEDEDEEEEDEPSAPTENSAEETDEVTEAAAEVLSLDAVLAAVTETIDKRLAAAITVKEKGEPVDTDLSGLGHDNVGADKSRSDARNEVTLASTGEFSREQLRKDIASALRNQDKGTTGEMIKLGTISDFKKPEVMLTEGASDDNFRAVTQSGAEYLDMSQDEVLTASLCCAPLDPIRELRTWCDSSTGLFTLPKVGAPYGGVNYAIPSNACGLTLTGTFTWNEECEPGAAAQSDKPCQVIECGTFEEVRVNAFGWCFEYTNSQAKFNPEQLEYWLSEARCRFEHVDSNRLLDLVLTHPRVATQVGTPDTIAAAGGSAFGDLAEILALKFEEMRRALAAPGLRPNVVAPVWINDLLFTDNLRRGGNTPGGPGFTQLVNSLGGTVQYVQHWQAPATGAGVATWPEDIEFLIHAPGVFREVDGGQLDFGLVRDSELNKQNKVRIMFEKWNALAFMGPNCSVNYVEVTGLCAGGAVGPRINTCA